MVDANSRQFTANYENFRARGRSNAYGGSSNSRSLSASNGIAQYSGYTSSLYGFPKSDVAHRHVGYIAEGRNNSLGEDIKTDLLLTAIGGSAGSKGLGKSQVWTFTQNEAVDNEFAKEARNLYVMYPGAKEPVPLIDPKTNKLNVEAINRARFGLRQDDPTIRITSPRGGYIKENWDGHTKFLTFRKNAEGKLEIAYTIGTDVAGGATMDSHGNSGGTARFLNSFHDNNVTTVEVVKGIPHNNLFGNSTVALSSKFDITPEFEKSGWWDIFSPSANFFIKRLNNSNIANINENALASVRADYNDLLNRTNLANYYNSLLGKLVFIVPETSHDIKLKFSEDRLQTEANKKVKEFEKKLEKVKNQSSNNNSSNNSNNTSKSNSSKDLEKVNYWLDHLTPELKAKLATFQKHGGKLTFKEFYAYTTLSEDF